MTESTDQLSKTCMVAVCLMVLAAAGCKGPAWSNFYAPPAAAPLGSLSDAIWQNQEINAEYSDFVIHEHEFELQPDRLNTGGEDHVKQIAARLLGGQDAQVVVERSMSSPRADTEHHYPVHPNPELDMRRRDLVVRALRAMGVVDADERVVVAPAFAQGITGNEAEAAYRVGLGGGAYGAGNGFGGGFGGFTFGGF
jgi:hypothetical protein